MRQPLRGAGMGEEVSPQPGSWPKRAGLRLQNAPLLSADSPLLLFSLLLVQRPFFFTPKVRTAKSSAPPFPNGFSSRGRNSTGKEVSLRGARGPEPASSRPRPLPPRPWLPPSAPVAQPWNPPSLPWPSRSLGQISFSKAFHRVRMTASGSHQLDVLFLFSSESSLLPLVSHHLGRVLGTRGAFSLACDRERRPRGAPRTVGETYRVSSPARHTPGGWVGVCKQADRQTHGSEAPSEGGRARPSLFPGSPSPRMTFGN